MADAPTHTLVEFSVEEAKIVTDKLTAVLVEHSGQFYIRRLISDDGKIEATLNVLKKVALIPKEEGVPSPIQAADLKDNGGNDNEATGEKANAPAA